MYKWMAVHIRPLSDADYINLANNRRPYSRTHKNAYAIVAVYLK